MLKKVSGWIRNFSKSHPHLYGLIWFVLGGIIIGGIIVGDIIPQFVSPLLLSKIAPHAPWIDKEPPEIIRISSNTDLGLPENIVVTFEERGGSGLDKVNSYIKLNVALSISSVPSHDVSTTLLSVPFNFQVDGLIDFPDEKTVVFKTSKLNISLPPAVYTVEVQLKDRGGNSAKPVISTFYILENPSLSVKFDKTGEERYSFFIGSDAYFTSIEEIRIFVTLPSVIKNPS